jgi:fused signal recognition particle receptor
MKQDGRTVLLAAADTFRAAAVEQLQIWAGRVGVDCISQGKGADPAAVVFDALGAAEARGMDVLIVDTAGRLHTKTNLMAELGKVARVIRKRTGKDPETLLVVDGNTGQNGLSQARIFAETIPIQGLILTKLDGTAKGGIVVAIAETMGLPVAYVGMGEKLEDLAVFDAEQFTEALFAGWSADQELEPEG